MGIGSRCEVAKVRLSLTTNSDVLTTDFNLHGADAVELRHALDFSEANFGAVWKCMSLVLYADNHTRIILTQHERKQNQFDRLQM